MIDIEKYFDKERSKISDIVVRIRFRIILLQCIYNNREDTTLCKYINEMEFRNMRYRV